jgi:hypothetical protein
MRRPSWEVSDALDASIQGANPYNEGLSCLLSKRDKQAEYDKADLPTGQKPE